MTSRSSHRQWGKSSRSLCPPNVVASRKRGVIRVDLSALTNPRVAQLSDAEFRAVVHLWAWFARYSDDEGEVPREWLKGFSFGSTDSGRPRRVTKMLARLIERGLVEEREYDDGTRTFAIVGWRDFRPADLTSAERKRRFRKRLYGTSYHGTEGDRMEVVLPSADEVAAIEAEGRAFIAELDRVRELEELGAAVVCELKGERDSEARGDDDRVAKE